MYPPCVIRSMLLAEVQCPASTRSPHLSYCCRANTEMSINLCLCGCTRCRGRMSVDCPFPFFAPLAGFALAPLLLLSAFAPPHFSSRIVGLNVGVLTLSPTAVSQFARRTQCTRLSSVLSPSSSVISPKNSQKLRHLLLSAREINW